MDLFKWVGRKKREEEWMRQPRRVPDYAQGLPEDSNRFVMTREYVNDEDKNLRMYLAAWQPDPKVDMWEIVHVEYNLKHEGVSASTFAWDVRDPVEVLKSLRNYERKSNANEALIQHPEERATYRPFANKYGIHFDDAGNIFRVETETPLAKGTFMNREALDKLFHKEAAKSIPLDSWEGIYKGIVDFRSPDWTMNEQAFGLPSQYQNVGAVAADTQPDSMAIDIKPVATSVWEVAAAGGGVANWKGGAASIPTAAQVAEAQQKLASGEADKLAVEPAPAPTPVTDASPAEKKADGANPTNQPLAATAPSSNPPPEEKKPLPPLPLRISGKFGYIHAQQKTWGNFGVMGQLTWKRPATFDDVTQGKGYPEYAYYMQQMMEKLNKLPDTLTSKTSDRYSKELAVKEFSRYAASVPFRSGRRGIAKHDCDATILVGMLRAGAAVYAENFGPGKKFTPDGLQLISTIGKLCVQFAIDRLEVPAEEAAKIADVITKGKDPFGPELPLEKAFAKHPAGKFIPAPPSQHAYITPTKKPKKKPEPPKRRSSWDDGW